VGTIGNRTWGAVPCHAVLAMRLAAPQRGPAMLVDRKVTVSIDSDRCIGCGECLRVCPSRTFTISGGKARVTGIESINCGHCAAVCPAGAVTVGALSPQSLAFEGFALAETWVPPGSVNPGELVGLMASRRSCRNFLPTPVPRSALNDLIRAGTTAPSGSNCQPWTFTALTGPEAVRRLGEAVADHFVQLNRLAARSWLRSLLKWLGRPELDHYYRNYHTAIRDGLREYRQTGVDRLFHGAGAAIIVATRPDSSCPGEDALLATQNMLLAAHAMGLGTCLVGFAVAAMQRDRRIGARFGIPTEETVRAAIVTGFPDEVYQRPAGRKPATIRIVTR
jgi:nitroreductase/NAD-dependent dihydropyrimidine dehydrogenase PreA subunit